MGEAGIFFPFSEIDGIVMSFNINKPVL